MSGSAALGSNGCARASQVFAVFRGGKPLGEELGEIGGCSGIKFHGGAGEWVRREGRPRREGKDAAGKRSWKSRSVYYLHVNSPKGQRNSI